MMIDSFSKNHNCWYVVKLWQDFINSLCIIHEHVYEECFKKYENWISVYLRYIWGVKESKLKLYLSGQKWAITETLIFKISLLQ